METESDDYWRCAVCDKPFDSHQGMTVHLGYCLRRGDFNERARQSAEPAARRQCVEEALQAKKALRQDAELSHDSHFCKWLSLTTKLRCAGVGDGLISDVRMLIGSVMSRVNDTVRSYLSATPVSDAAELTELIDAASMNGSAGWPHTMHTTLLENTVRRATMPHVAPVERVLHKESLVVTLPDGRQVNTVLKRTCTDMPAVLLLDRQLQADHRLMPKIRASAERLRSRRAARARGVYPPLREAMDGSVVRDHPATEMAIRGDGSPEHPYVMYFCLSWDEIGLENPIGPHHNNHDVMMIYWVCLCFDLDFRLQKHMIQLQTIAMAADVKQLGFGMIIGDLKPVAGEKPDTSSWAASMRVLDPRGPGREFRYADTDPPAKVSEQPTVQMVGVHVCGVTDSPAGTLATSTKSTFGPQTRRMCRHCYAGQGEGPRQEGTHFQQCCGECGSPLDPEACPPWPLRTVESFAEDKAESLLKTSDPELSAFMVEKGWNDFELAFSAVWGFDPFRGTPQDIMHMFPEGTSSTQLAATLYLLMTKYGVETGLTLDKLNDLIATFPWPSHAARPAFLLDSVRHGTEGGKPSPDCGLKLTAAATHTFVLYSVELLRSVIPTGCEWPCWKAWLLHVEVYSLLQTRVIDDDPNDLENSTIVMLNKSLREHWEAFKAVEEFEALCRAKNHFQTHMPLDGRRWGPWRGFSALHFELFHMQFKGWGRAINFKNAPFSLASRWAEWSEFEYWSRAHLYKEDMAVIGNPMYTELVTAPAASPLLSAVLRTANRTSVQVEWYRTFSMGTKLISTGDYLYVRREAGTEPRLCRVGGLFHITSTQAVGGESSETALLVNLRTFDTTVLRRNTAHPLPFASQSDLEDLTKGSESVVACKSIVATLLTAVPTVRVGLPSVVFFEH